MVSQERRFQKLNRMESKILAYHRMIASGHIPVAQGTLIFAAERLGNPAMEHEIARAHQAMYDLKEDIKKQLAALDIPWKDYITT